MTQVPNSLIRINQSNQPIQNRSVQPFPVLTPQEALNFISDKFMLPNRLQPAPSQGKALNNLSVLRDIKIVDRTRPYPSLLAAQSAAAYEIPGNQMIVGNGYQYKLVDINRADLSKINQKQFTHFGYQVVGFSLEDSWVNKKFRFIPNGHYSEASILNDMRQKPGQYLVLKEGTLLRSKALTPTQYKMVQAGNFSFMGNPSDAKKNAVMLANSQGGKVLSEFVSLPPGADKVWKANLNMLGYQQVNVRDAIAAFCKMNNIQGPNALSEFKRVMVVMTACRSNLGNGWNRWDGVYGSVYQCAAHVAHIENQMKKMGLRSPNAENYVMSPSGGYTADWVQSFTVGFHDPKRVNSGNFGIPLKLHSQSFASSGKPAQVNGFLKPGSMVAWDNLGAATGNGHFGVYLGKGANGKLVTADAFGTFSLNYFNNLNDFQSYKRTIDAAPNKQRIHAIMPY